jgi:hypothetical protein
LTADPNGTPILLRDRSESYLDFNAKPFSLRAARATAPTAELNPKWADVKSSRGGIISVGLWSLRCKESQGTHIHKCTTDYCTRRATKRGERKEQESRETSTQSPDYKWHARSCCLMWRMTQ